MSSAPIAFLAGEASGDLLAAPVIAELARLAPGTPSIGLAGDRMIAAGCEPWHHVRELSVRGYVEVLRELPRLLRLRRSLERRLRERGCAAVVGVDSPDFNLAIETRLRAGGVPTVHYVSPSIWAWRADRIEKIRRAADRVLLVFPFEQEIYRRAGIPATYVGHPLASSIAAASDRGAARLRLGLDAGSAIIALLPGSRAAEVDFIAPCFLAAVRSIRASEPRTRFILPVADRSLRLRIERMLASEPALASAITLFDGRSHDCLEACDACLVASGTATLEAALYGRPMVIVYKVPLVSAWIMRAIGGYLPWVGLPNILAGESLVPELLQEAATGEAIARELLGLLGDAPRLRMLTERFRALHESLRRDTAALAAQAILDTAARRRPAAEA